MWHLLVNFSPFYTNLNTLACNKVEPQRVFALLGGVLVWIVHCFYAWICWVQCGCGCLRCIMLQQVRSDYTIVSCCNTWVKYTRIISLWAVEFVPPAKLLWHQVCGVLSECYWDNDDCGWQVSQADRPIIVSILKLFDHQQRRQGWNKGLRCAKRGRSRSSQSKTDFGWNEWPAGWKSNQCQCYLKESWWKRKVIWIPVDPFCCQNLCLAL